MSFRAVSSLPSPAWFASLLSSPQGASLAPRSEVQDQGPAYPANYPDGFHSSVPEEGMEPPFFPSPGSAGGQQISPTLRAFEEQMRQTTNEMLAHMMGWPSGQYSTPDFAQGPVPTQPQGPGGIAYPPPGYGVIMTPGLEPMIYDPFGPTPYQSSAGMSDAQKEALLHQRESDFMMQSRMGGVGGYGGYGGYSGGYTGNYGGYPYCRQQQDGFYYR